MVRRTSPRPMKTSTQMPTSLQAGIADEHADDEDDQRESGGDAEHARCRAA